MEDIEFANCWAHVRRFWLNAERINGSVGVKYCDELYRLERDFKNFKPSKRRKLCQKYSKPIVEEFFLWIKESTFYGNDKLAKAADYTVKREKILSYF